LTDSYQTWTLFEGKHLFNTQNSEGDYSATQHLAEMIALLGMPAPEFLGRSRASLEYFNDDGKPPAHDRFATIRTPGTGLTGLL